VVDRDRFFASLAQIGEGAGDYKVIVSLRTEFYGRLIAALRQGLHAARGVREYFLTDPGRYDLIEFLTRPTRGEVLPYSDEVPFNRYNFRFRDRDDVPGKVADQLLGMGREDGVLPLAQVIGAQLWERVRDRDPGEREVTEVDLKALGGFDGALRTHVLDLIAELWPHDPARPRAWTAGVLAALVRDLVAPGPREGFQRLMSDLTLAQVDGALASRMISERELVKRYRRSLGPDSAAWLADAERRRLLRLATRRGPDGKEERTVSLGHDALARVAYPWKQELERRAARRRRLFQFVLVAVTLAVVGVAAVGGTYLARRIRVLADQLTSAKGHNASLDESHRAALAEVYAGRIGSVMAYMERGELNSGWKELYECRPLQRGWEWRLLAGEMDQSQMVVGRSMSGFTKAVHVLVGSREMVRAGAMDGSVWGWDAHNDNAGQGLAFKFTKKHHQAPVVDLVLIDPDKRYAISVAADGSVCFWSTQTGNLIASNTKALGGARLLPSLEKWATPYHAQHVAALSPDGEWLCWLGNREGRLFHISGFPQAPEIKQAAALIVKSGEPFKWGEEQDAWVTWDQASTPPRLITLRCRRTTGAKEQTTGELIAWEVPSAKPSEPIQFPGLPTQSVVRVARNRMLVTAGATPVLYDLDALAQNWPNAARKLPEHADSVTALALSPDGSTLASGGGMLDKKIRLVRGVIAGEYAARSRGEGNEFRGHENTVTSLEFCRVDASLISASLDGTVRVWDLQRPPTKLVVPADAFCPEPSASRGFDLRLMSSVKAVRDIPTEGKNLIIVAAADEVLLFRIFECDGKMAVDTDEKRLTVKAPEIEDLRKKLVGLWPPHELIGEEKNQIVTEVTSIVGYTPSRYPIVRARFSRGAGTSALVATSQRPAVHAWDIQKPGSYAVVNINCHDTSDRWVGVGDVGITDDGRLIAASVMTTTNRHWLLAWPLQRARAKDCPELLVKLELGKGSVAARAVAVHPLGTYLAGATPNGGYPGGAILVWKREGSGNPPRYVPVSTSLPKSESPVEGLDFSPDGRLLAAVCEDGRLLIWEVETRHTLDFPTRFTPMTLTGVRFSPDSRQVGVTTRRGDAYLCPIWIVEQKLKDAAVRGIAHENKSVNGLSFQPGERSSRFATSTVAGFQVWDSNSSPFLKLLNIPAPAFDIDWDSAGVTLAVAGPSDEVSLFCDLSTRPYYFDERALAFVLLANHTRVDDLRKRVLPAIAHIPPEPLDAVLNGAKHILEGFGDDPGTILREVLASLETDGQDRAAEALRMAQMAYAAWVENSPLLDAQPPRTDFGFVEMVLGAAIYRELEERRRKLYAPVRQPDTIATAMPPRPEEYAKAVDILKRARTHLPVGSPDNLRALAYLIMSCARTRNDADARFFLKEYQELVRYSKVLNYEFESLMREATSAVDGEGTPP
jgi:WD40 repeat protein